MLPVRETKKACSIEATMQNISFHNQKWSADFHTWRNIISETCSGSDKACSEERNSSATKTLSHPNKKDRTSEFNLDFATVEMGGIKVPTDCIHLFPDEPVGCNNLRMSCLFFTQLIYVLVRQPHKNNSAIQSEILKGKY